MRQSLKCSLLLLALAGLFTGLGACEGERVVLNERVFELPAMSPAGGGCSTWDLSALDPPSGESACGPGARGACFGVHQTVKDSRVVITIRDRDRRLLLEKRYDEAFFASGKRDDFTVTAPSGDAQLFRYWGTRDANGNARCAPIDDTGETVPKL